MRQLLSFLVVLVLLTPKSGNAQFNIQTSPSGSQIEAAKANKVKQHATWTVNLEPKQATIGQTVDLIIQATIEEGWYLYSSDFDPNLGPIVTSIQFNQSDGYTVLGKLKAVHPKKKFDEIWEGDITYFIGTGEFRQSIKILKENPVVKGTIEYQTCTVKDGACVQGEQDWTLTIKTVAPNQITKNPAPIEPKPTSPQKIQPEKQTILSPTSTVDTTPTSTSSMELENVPTKTDSTFSHLNTSTNPPVDISLWMFFVQAFLFGLAGLVTPCVFPMVPMTVTFFTKTSKTHREAIKKGLIYGSSIIFIYTVMGTLVALFFGADAANFISTHWLPNLFFFVVFVVFAASFLGLFEITLPNWLVNKADAQSDKGGLIGIFFMAMTIVVVSFSCTGPIVGTVLIESAGGKFIKPIIGMFGFSLGFSLPFTLFAMFPSWLKALPKSGGWLNSVKVSLGFLELALALKFLSQADQVYHWGLLDREIFIALWIVVFSLLGMYLIRKIKLSHDDLDYSEQAVSVPRLFFSISAFAFVVYLIPGMFGAPLKALSGYLPPLSTSDFVLGSQASSHSKSTQSGLCGTPKYGELFHLPHGLQGYFDLKQAQDCAKQQNKPLFIDFTGHGCANCREMEANVWSDPAILQRLSEDFVILSLYVDERKELPKEDWYISSYDGKEKTTIGKQNSDLEIRLFNNNAQPLYVIANPELTTWLEPKGFDRDIGAFAQFLEEGKTVGTKTNPKPRL